MKKLFVFFIFLNLSLFASDREAELEKLKKMIKEKNLPFEVGPTEISKYKLEEVTGLKVPKDFNPSLNYKELPLLVELPEKLDYRELGYITPARNQKNCGSCWAFATVGPLESAILKQDSQEVDLSEQALISCNPWGYNCDGGWYAFDMFLDPGAVLESCQPYKASNNVKCNNCAGAYKILEWGYISQSDRPSIEEIKTALLLYGPLAVGMHASKLFQFYNGGVLTLDEDGPIDHAVTLVGWDDSLEPNGAWIIKNSWGTGWGENGFGYVAYGILQLGYAPAYVVYKFSEMEDKYEPDNSAAEAKELILNEVQEHRGESADWVYFELSNNCTYMIYTINFLGSDTVITLYKDDGITEISENDDYNRNPRYSVLFFKPSDNGRYYLKIDQLMDYSENYFYHLGLKPIRCEFK